MTSKEEAKIMNKFINLFLKNKEYYSHSDIDSNLTFKLSSIFNYDELLNEEDKQFIAENFGENYEYIAKINEEKKEKILELKKSNIKNESKMMLPLQSENKSILRFKPPEFEIYFIAQLYVNGMPIQPEYTSKLFFSSSIEEIVPMRYKYKELTKNSYIKICLYSMQLEEKKNFLGSTIISIFDENLNITQGRHTYRIFKKKEVDLGTISLEQNNIEEEQIDKEIDLLVHSYNDKKNSNYEKISPFNKGKEEESAEVIINSYTCNEKYLEIKNEYQKNYEKKLKNLLIKTHHAFFEVDFQDFKHPIIFSETILSTYKRPLKKKDFKSRLEKNSKCIWIYDSHITSGKTLKDFIRKENPILEKFSTLSRIEDDSLFAKELRPTPYESKRINELLNTPDFITLEDNDSLLFWKYRYELLKSNKRSALTKILNAVKWGERKSENEVIKNILFHWENVEICDILYMLSAKFCLNDLYLNQKKICDGFAEVRAYAVKHLNKLSDEDLNFILLQLVNALRYEDPKNSKLRKCLINRCTKSVILATSFCWFLQVERDKNQKKTEKEKNEAEKNKDKMVEIYDEIFCEFKESIKENKEVYLAINSQLEFRENLVNITKNELSKAPKADGKKKRLREILAPDGSYYNIMNGKNYSLPIAPQLKVTGVTPEKCSVFKSALCPVKYYFNISQETQKHNTKADKGGFEVMFKYGDDLRQDQLILQMFNYMDQLLKKVHLDFEFTTYQVLATSKSDGFVEFVPNSTTIFDILKKYNKEITPFLKECAEETKVNYQKILSSFINSNAGYCVVTYLLGIGDRHLENLLMDKNGKLFHIDFGYILGKDPKPYPPPMKLCKEMIDCMGGVESENYKEFQNKCVSAYWVLRDNARLIVNMFYLMIDSGIPEINNIEALTKLNEKFMPGSTRQEAANSLISKLDESVGALFAKIMEKFHSWAVYWR